MIRVERTYVRGDSERRGPTVRRAISRRAYCGKRASASVGSSSLRLDRHRLLTIVLTRGTMLRGKQKLPTSLGRRETMRRSALLATVLTAATFALAPLGAGAARSRTVTVCPSGPPLCDFATIPAAIAAVSDGDTIRVAPGRYAGGFTIGKSVSIVGSGQAVTTIVGEGVLLTRSGSVQVAVGRTVEIRGVTITGNSYGTGLVNLGTLLLVHSTVSRNGVGGRHGPAPAVSGIYNRGSLTLRSSTVDHNGPGYPAGIGGILNDGSMTLDDSSLIHNRSEYGGIVNHGTAILRRTVLDDNGEWMAGGIVNSGKLVLIKCLLLRNWADFGGAIANTGDATIVDTTIVRNWSLVGGYGGIDNNRGTVRISRSTISHNYADHGTGGLNNTEGVVAITDSRLSDNSSSDGGGIRTFGGTLAVIRSVIAHNSIQPIYSGGGIHNEGTQMTLTETRIVWNYPDNCYGCPEPRDASHGGPPLWPFASGGIATSAGRTK